MDRIGNACFAAFHPIGLPFDSIKFRQMLDETRRRTPDELLAEIELEERHQQRGKLKVFLGYASGVGKSFQMLDEGRRRSERGEDVVACALQPDYPPEVAAVVQKLEIIPTAAADGAHVIDLPTVIRRRPEVALIDGLAYDNPPGSTHPHRWQDVEQLLECGISVLTTVNIQYLENVKDDVQRITGTQSSFVIPRSFLEESADEITVVDAPETALQDVEDGSARLREKHRLSRLREIALLVAATVVDRQLETYLRSQGTELTWGVQERILVLVTPDADATEMLESGRRNADRFQGEFHVVYMDQQNGSNDDNEPLSHNLQCARDLAAEVHSLAGNDLVEAILQFSVQQGITQIFVGRTHRPKSAWNRLRGEIAVRLIRAAEGIDVVVYPKH